MSSSHLLLWIAYLPLIGAALLLLFPKEQGRRMAWFATGWAFLDFLLSLLLLRGFDPADDSFQTVSRRTSGKAPSTSRLRSRGRMLLATPALPVFRFFQRISMMRPSRIEMTG